MSVFNRQHHVNMHFKPIKSNKGATLIELLISLALLAIITTVFIQIINNSLSLRMRSDFEKEASAIAMSTVEGLKQADQEPASGFTVTQVDGYSVETTLVDVTSTLALSNTALGQAQDPSFDNPDLNFNLGENLSVLKSNGVLSDTSLAGLVDNQIIFSVLPINGSLDTHRYQIEFTNNLGAQTINLGNYTRVNNLRKKLRINVVSTLSGNIKWIIQDQTGEPLHVGVYDNTNQRLQLSTQGIGTDVLISDGYKTNMESESLVQKYYEVTVVVRKNGEEYARILTTWAIKGD